MFNSLHSFIRDRKGKLKGVILALKVGKNKVNIGWSLCSRRDIFQKETGLQLATGRAVAGNGKAEVPQVVTKQLDGFIDRASKYFKPVGKGSVSFEVPA